MIFATPDIFSKSDAKHQKQPPARVATFKLVGSSFIGLFTSCFFASVLETRSARIPRKHGDKELQGKSKDKKEALFSQPTLPSGVCRFEIRRDPLRIISAFALC